MEESRTITENGVSQTLSVSVELGIAVMHPPERIVILQMDTDGRIAVKSEYPPDEVPEVIQPLPGTAYLIVETHRTPDLINPVLRTLYNAGSEAVATFYERENGVLNRRFIQVDW
jgi:hypothetical protein